MTAADVAAELHALVMEHGLTVDGVTLGQAIEDSTFDTTGEVILGFQDGSSLRTPLRMGRSSWYRSRRRHRRSTGRYPVLMCACDVSYVCASCRDSSRFDDVYADFREPDPVFVGGEATDDD